MTPESRCRSYNTRRPDDWRTRERRCRTALLIVPTELGIVQKCDMLSPRQADHYTQAMLLSQVQPMTVAVVYKFGLC